MQSKHHSDAGVKTSPATHCGVVPRKVAEEQPGDGRPERAVVGVASAVLEAPRGQVGSCCFVKVPLCL